MEELRSTLVSYYLRLVPQMVQDMQLDLRAEIALRTKILKGVDLAISRLMIVTPTPAAVVEYTHYVEAYTPQGRDIDSLSREGQMIAHVVAMAVLKQLEDSF